MNTNILPSALTTEILLLAVTADLRTSTIEAESLRLAVRTPWLQKPPH